MPKINVYLPDDLAAAVREAGIPVSPICQKALAETVRLVGLARKTVAALRRTDFDPTNFPKIGDRIGGLATPRLRAAIDLARVASLSSGFIETKHLLIGLIDEGNNFATRILRALDVDPDELRDTAIEVDLKETPTRAGDNQVESTNVLFQWEELSIPSRFALASALEASIDRGHNYLGCEHLLVGLLDNRDSGAATALQQFAVDKPSAIRALNSALAGFAHAKEVSSPTEVGKLDEIVRRLGAIEARLDSVGA
jgi:ATP-dependent Clp protease ATP-binding subunit ClpA